MGICMTYACYVYFPLRMDIGDGRANEWFIDRHHLSIHGMYVRIHPSSQQQQYESAVASMD